MPPKKPTLSASRLKCFIQCPRKHWYSYVKKIKTPQGSPLVFGNCYHDAIELNYAQKIKTSVDIAVEKVTDRFQERFVPLMRAGQMEPGESMDRLLELGCKMLTVHHLKIAPMVQPLFVEKSFLLSLGNNFPFDLSGRWDVIDENGVVIDNKSYKTPPQQKWVDQDIQMSVYSLAYRLLFGEVENGLRIDAVTKKNIKVCQVFTKRNNADATWLLGQIERVVQAMQCGINYPIDDSPLCCPAYCGHWNRCKRERNY